MTEPGETAVLDRAVNELTAAEVVAFGGVGFAARPLPVTAAYRTLAAAFPERPEQVRAALSRLLAEATPAGRVYAATLLTSIDPAAARTAWRSMTDDRADLRTFSGCLLRQTTLGEYAAEQLAALESR